MLKGERERDHELSHRVGRKRGLGNSHGEIERGEWLCVEIDGKG